MLNLAAPTADDLGISLVDFRIKQVEFMDEVRNSVYQQMAAERARIATDRRFTGRAEAEKRRAGADREVTVILASAYRDGQLIRGEGDATAAEVYASAYTRDPEFYAFYRSIDAYRKSVGGKGDVLVLDPNNEFFRYLNQSDGQQ
jgi:membrane protease subunit HflC